MLIPWSRQTTNNKILRNMSSDLSHFCYFCEQISIFCWNKSKYVLQTWPLSHLTIRGPHSTKSHAFAWWTQLTPWVSLFTNYITILSYYVTISWSGWRSVVSGLGFSVSVICYVIILSLIVWLLLTVSVYSNNWKYNSWLWWLHITFKTRTDFLISWDLIRISHPLFHTNITSTKEKFNIWKETKTSVIVLSNHFLNLHLWRFN